MDFNPLNLLAAAALSDKGSQSENKETYPGKKECVSDQDNNSDGADGKDANDNQTENMGKTKSSFLSKPVRINSSKVNCEMSPQKISWSPEAFLSCLDKPSIEHEKLILEELSPTCIKDKVKSINMCCDDNKKQELSERNSIQNDSDSVEDEKNVPILKDVKVEDNHDYCEDTPSFENILKTDCVDSPSVKDIKEETDSADVVRETADVPQDVKSEFEGGGGQSDTDTAETSDSKTVADDLPEMTFQDMVSLDHSYCLIPGQMSHISSTDMLDEDIDVCSDNSPLTEDSEQRSRNFSLDCHYLKSGIKEGKSVNTAQLHHFMRQADDVGKMGSPSKSSAQDSALRLSKTGDSSAFKQVSVLSPERPGPSYGKFKIGTFASFSSSNLELEKYLRGLDSPSEKRIDGSSNEHDHSNKGLQSPVYSPTVQPLLQSPTLDWDRSEAGSEAHDDSSDARTPHRLSPDISVEKISEWSHPMYHDHDYCVKSQQLPAPEDIVKLPLNKRKYTKRKNKLDSVDREKIMKAKYLKKELLKDSFIKSAPNPSTEPAVSVHDSGVKTNPVGRPRKRPLEKSFEEEIDPETGAKMKITGKFQDQYVYYLSKSRTTSRRRQTPSLPMLSDKIIVPDPKPGDIIVPHLTDADIEIVRTKGRSALNIPERPHMPHFSSGLHRSLIPPPLPNAQPNEFMCDVDSHIVSTILSMENDNLASPSSSHSHDLTQNSDLYNGQPSISDSDPNMTSEQVLNFLLSVEEEPSLLNNSAGLFPPLQSEHFSDSELGNGPSNLNCKLGINSELQASQSPIGNHSFEHIVKSETEESSGLPEDLSSLISHSQVTTSSTTQDSQSSIKSEFSSDLSPLGTPSLTSSTPRLTSIEKTLDYLGVKDGELKLKQSDLFTSKIHSEEIPIQPPAHNPPIVEDDTPWIVTVTLYFNDVPAIMIVSEPYIRLVDIHKQILPAKDTGILKKRCQLLNIPVLNCTEMHRYFLVQYGKAYNSKSTLIISKDQATSLVGYYANPQPRIGRGEESGSRRYSEGSSMSPVPADVVPAPVKKRGCGRSNKKGSQISGLTLPGIGVTGVKAEGSSSQASDSLNKPDSLNKRTRHKKVNYLEMLRGEEKERPTDPIMETIESVLKESPHQTISHSKLSKDKCSVTSKTLSKKKLNRSQSCDKKTKEDSNHKRKSGDNKKRVKNSGKLLKSSKQKGSNSKLGKKQEKNLKEVETGSELDVECVESSLSKSNKFKPLKLKVNSLLNFSSQRKQIPSSSSLSSPSKKGLFSRSNSSTSSALEEHPTRVLAVAHQAALSSEEGDSHLPSQPADIHLDLFTKSSSACVCCHTCSQFLSVPHFMRHHHVPMDNEWLATEAAHRILVPRNKENISEEERRLWEEFHRLQEAIGGFGEGDDDSDSEGDSDEESDLERNGGNSSLETSGASFLSVDVSHDERIDLSYESQHSQSSHNTSVCTVKNSLLHTKPVSHDKNISVDFSSNRKLEQIYKNDLSSLSSGHNASVLSHDQESGLHVRTSSRRRKSKQLFSIENYCTPTKKSPDDENLVSPSVSGFGH